MTSILYDELKTLADTDQIIKRTSWREWENEVYSEFGVHTYSTLCEDTTYNVLWLYSTTSTKYKHQRWGEYLSVLIQITQVKGSNTFEKRRQNGRKSESSSRRGVNWYFEKRPTWPRMCLVKERPDDAMQFWKWKGDTFRKSRNQSDINHQKQGGFICREAKSATVSILYCMLQ